jgi:hypothetical protein
MNWFKRKKQSDSDVAVATIGTKYPDVVEQIHHEFETSGDLLLAEAQAMLDKKLECDIDKAERLTKLGFTGTSESKAYTQLVQSKENAQKTAEMVLMYKRKYINNKFITEEQVKNICTKYNLVCGSLDRYKGFVPDKNLKELESFLKKNKMPRIATVTPYDTEDTEAFDIYMDDYVRKGNDWYVVFTHKSTGEHAFQQEASMEDGINYYGGAFKEGKKGRISGRIVVKTIQICAPLKDMDTEGMELKGYKLEKHIPDPVILQPVMGGYLIITAWGDEASDPEVVNEIMN